MNTITKLNVKHIRSVAKKLTGRDLTVWSNGGRVYVAAGEGSEGSAIADKLAAASELPTSAKRSSILGSVAELERKAALGLTYQVFVILGA